MRAALSVPSKKQQLNLSKQEFANKCLWCAYNACASLQTEMVPIRYPQTPCAAPNSGGFVPSDSHH